MILCFGIFLVSVVLCMSLLDNLLPAMMVGLILFFGLGLQRGYPAKDLWAMAWKKGRDSLDVVPVFLIIGSITALWRADGTISFFLYYGIRAIPPQLFVLLAFLLPAAMSFLLGSSYGVCGTAGVVLMTLARSGSVNIAVAAGAVIAGAYFGDRCSPMSSIANFVTSCTGTDIYSNVRHMLKTAALPTVLTVVIFAVLAIQNPLQVMDESVLNALRENFVLSWPVLVPALIMLVLPALRVPVKWAMLTSATLAFGICLSLQHMALMDTVRTAIFGYTPVQPDLQNILSGGGLTSMINVSFVVFFASMYAGVLEGIDALAPLKEKADSMVDRLGLYPVTMLVSTVNVMVFCNQIAMAIMDEQILAESYRKRGASPTELAIDISNTGVLIAGLIPWSVAITVPLSMLGAPPSAIPYCVLLYLIPICYLFTRKWFVPSMQAEKTGKKSRKS